MLRWLLVLLALPTQALARGGGGYCGPSCRYAEGNLLMMLVLGAIVLGALGYGLWHALLFFNQQKHGPQAGDDRPMDLAAKGAIGILIAGGFVAATGGLALGGVVIIVLFVVGLVIYNSGR